MSESGRNHIAVSDEMEGLVKANIAQSTVKTCRYAMQ